MAASIETPNTMAGAGAPPGRVFLITPSDDDELTYVTRAISFAVAGALKVTTLAGDTVVIPSGALAAGVQHSLCVIKVFATGSGAGMGLVGYA